MSHSTTSGGGRRRGLLRFSSMRPPERSAARSVARMSARAPRGSRAKRRVGISWIGRRSRAIAALARASSSNDIFSKSIVRSCSRSEKVIAASISTCSSGLSRVCWCGCKASARRRIISAPSSRGISTFICGSIVASIFFEQLGIAPEDVKRLVEQLPLVRPVDKDRVQCPVEIGAIGDADRSDRLDRVDHLARPDRQPGGAQRAREMHQIGDEAAVSLAEAVGLT